MNVGILGSGKVAQTLGTKIASLGHPVMLGARDAAKLTEWAEGTANTQIGTLGETAQFGEILFNCISGSGSLEALTLAGAENMAGKILIDLANPLDFSQGFPALFVANTDSLGEQIQRAFPDVKVVKALNTVTAALMVNPSQLGGDHFLPLCGNDPEARATVADILKIWFGWQTILDLGDLSGARAMEGMLLMWIRLYGMFGTGMFNFTLVK
ncbi:MAG: NAD(P)-binding domain-containing protein [Anaerolineales bacterium]|nr:NAD(P)-binding domain-containing protein [Anaerolineales bacterium]